MRSLRCPSRPAALLLLAALCTACGSKKDATPPPATDEGVGLDQPLAAADPEVPAAKGRLVILGFDGVDPRWLDGWMKEGKLPVLAKLTAAHGGAAYHRLRSTNPPQSPVAWTTFATGTPPGEHGIFDFIGRDLKGALPVMPKIATTAFEVPDEGPPVARNLRTGRPFWQLLGNKGVRVVAINVPYSFPPDPMKQGRMLSGLGVPDVRETNSTFTYVGTDVTEAQQDRPPGGGAMVRLAMQGNSGSFQLEGPSIPGGQGDRMKLPVRVLRTAGALEVEVGGKKHALRVGKPSGWVELAFEHGGRKVEGIARLLALEADKQVRLFISPIGFHPQRPYSPLSYPKKFSAELMGELGGFYKTVGWDHDTSALNAEVIGEGEFLADMDSIEQDRKKMLMQRLDKGDWELLIWVSTSTDRVAHMLYRLTDPGHPRYDAKLAAKYGDAIQKEYERMDATVGEVLTKLTPDDTLLIISDHGFHGYRRGLHVNQWLRQQGLLTLRGDAEATDKQFFLDVDWSRTQAYAMGTGQIYINKAGRESRGMVGEAAVPALLDKIRTGLTQLRDGESPVVKNVYVGKDVFQGGRLRDAPDLQIAFAEHYRTSWETILGGVPGGIFADNPKKWSGDHAASDVEETPGILISNRAIAAPEPGIVDLAPTAVGFFGRKVPRHYSGKSLLGVAK